MRKNTLLVFAAVILVVLLSGCLAILEILGNKDGTTTTTTLPSSTTTTTISELESRTLSDENAVSGYADKAKLLSNKYIIQNKIIMTPATQVIEYSTNNGDFVIKEHSGPSLPGLVSFPSIFIGYNNEHQTINSNLPKRCDTLSSIITTWAWSDSGVAISAEFLPLYNLWFTSSAEGTIAGPEKSLDIWLSKPIALNPSGFIIKSNVSIPGISGVIWNVWSDGINITYVAVSELLSVNFDLICFIENAISRGEVANSDYLHDVFAGFKIWSGGTGLASSNFSVSVQ